jgi:hypothetical protein
MMRLTSPEVTFPVNYPLDTSGPTYPLANFAAVLAT